MPEEGNGKKAAWLSPDHPSHKWWVTLALMLGILTQGLNFGTLNVALPSMMTNLRADVETIQWVVTSFMVTRAHAPFTWWGFSSISLAQCSVASPEASLRWSFFG